MKRINKVILFFIAFLSFGMGMVYAAEMTGTVLMKTQMADRKGNINVRVYLDTTGNGVTDTVLGYKINFRQKEEDIVIVPLNVMIKEGSRITFDDSIATKPDFVRIIWHSLISIDGVSMAQRFPNPYWFPAAFAKAGS